MTTELATRPETVPAMREERSVEEVVAQIKKIQAVMAEVMEDGVHYGYIPGTEPKTDEEKKRRKPSLWQAGAQLLTLLFRLDPQYESVESWDGPHLTVKSTCTLWHIPTGQRVGSGQGSCSTRESKYAYRQSKRLCPRCGAETINKSKFPPKGKPQAQPGWYCYAKAGGCGVEFAADDPAITQQVTGRVANEELADVYNTVLKISNKRSLVAAVITSTAASFLWSQDIEDMAENAAAAPVYNAEVIAAAERGEGPPPPPEPSVETLFPTPEDDGLRARLAADAERLRTALKLTAKDVANYKQTYLGAPGALLHLADLAALTDLINALRARAGEPNFGTEPAA